MKSQSVWQEASEQQDQLFAAHAAALGQLSNAPRTCISHFAKKDKQGKPIPDYADLATIFDTIRPAMTANGLSVTQSFMPHGDDGGMMLVTTLGHKSGQFQRSYLPMKGNVPPQSLASTATYLKRIAICAIVGIAADSDDDGEQANASHAAASINDEGRIEKALIAKVRSAKDEAAVQAVLEQTARGVDGGQLSKAAGDRITLVAKDCASKLAKPAKKQPEPALAS